MLRHLVSPWNLRPHKVQNFEYLMNKKIFWSEIKLISKINFSLILRSSQRSCSVKKVFSELSQSPQENTCVGVCCEICVKLFSYVICEICVHLKNISEQLLLRVAFLVLEKCLNVRVMFGSAILETLNLTNLGGNVQAWGRQGHKFWFFISLFLALFICRLLRMIKTYLGNTILSFN